MVKEILCIPCGGKGFNWIAKSQHAGGVCNHCGGKGTRNVMHLSGVAITALMLSPFVVLLLLL